jgi:hypothetical protein
MGGGPCTHPARTDPPGVAARASDPVAMPGGTSGADALHLPRTVPDVPTAARPTEVIGVPAGHWRRVTEWAPRPSTPAAGLDLPGSCAAVADPASSKPPAISAALHTFANTTPERESTSQDFDGTAEREAHPGTRRPSLPCTSAHASHRRGRGCARSAEGGSPRRRGSTNGPSEPSELALAPAGRPSHQPRTNEQRGRPRPRGWICPKAVMAGRRRRALI